MSVVYKQDAINVREKLNCLHTHENSSILKDITAAYTAEEAVKVGLLYTGTGSPESVITASVGSLYLRSDGGASTTLYVKESGTGNTGWIAK